MIFANKLYEKFINKLKSDYILIPNTPKNKTAVNNVPRPVPYSVKSLEKDLETFKKLYDKNRCDKHTLNIFKILNSIFTPILISALLALMPFNIVNNSSVYSYNTVQVSTLDISDGSSHQKGKNKLSEMQEQYIDKKSEQANPKKLKKNTDVDLCNKQKDSFFKKKRPFLKKFFSKFKNIYVKVSPIYVIVIKLLELFSEAKELLWLKKSK